jgi:hypothetical protein
MEKEIQISLESVPPLTVDLLGPPYIELKGTLIIPAGRVLRVLRGDKTDGDSGK